MLFRMSSSTLLFPRLIGDPLERLFDMCYIIRKLLVSNKYFYIGFVEIFRPLYDFERRHVLRSGFPVQAGVAGVPKA